jgi:MFS family permease
VALRAVSRLSRSPAVLDLRSVLAERGFRRLFSTRLISQAGDGLYTAGFGAYVFFSATTYPNPAAAASAFAVLYLPYSLIGPFAGVFIDRWSRRQILLVSALVRAGLVAVTALLVLSGQLGVPLYVSALAALGVNRFFLASLSAALPHVVPGDKLVMANSVAPTVGGIVTSVAGISGVGLRLLLGGGHGSAALIVLAAGVCYLLAGLTAATMRHDLLGPVQEADRAPEPLSRALREVIHGLAAGVAYLTRRRGPAAAIGAIGGYRALYGIAFLMSILLYRNYFYPAGNGNAALGHFTLVVIVSAVGYGLAAVISPPVTRRLTKEPWITLLLVCSGAVAVLGATFTQPSFLVLGFVLGLTGQGIAISATTIIQEQTGDAYRGRAFALYDMMFNGVFVIGAIIGAAFIPVDGKSYPLIAVIAVGYLLVAAAYTLLRRGRARNVAAPPVDPPSASSPGSPPLVSPGSPPPASPGSSPVADDGTDSPSASAQRSNS